MAEPDCREAIDPPGETIAGEGSRTIRRNAAALGAGQMFTWAMTLAWTLVVPRLLGAGGMGMIITGMSVVTLLQIAMGGGTALYVTREIVVSPERAARIVASASLARLLLVPVFGIAIVVGAQLADYGARQDEVLYLCGAATALMLVGEPLLSYFQATERMHYMAIGDGINKASQGLAGIVLAVIGFGAMGFAACWVVTAGVVVVLSVRWARRYIHIRWRTTWVDLKDIVRGSATYWTGGLFFTIYAWIDTVMLSLMTNPTVVGWYGVPMKLWGTFLIIPSIALRVFLPRMVAANERSRAELNRVARVPIELVCVLSLPVATPIAVSAAPVVHLVYGPSFAHAVPVLIILGLNLVPMYLNMMLGSVCVAANRQGTWNWVFVGATLFNPAVNAILIPLTQHRFGNGAIGAAIALALTEALVACVGVAIVGRGIVGRSTARRVGGMALACGGMWLVVHLLGSTGPVVSLLAGCVALFVLAFVFRAITEDEQRQIHGFAERLAARAVKPLLRPRCRHVGRRLAARSSSWLTSTVPPTRPLENGANVLAEPSAAPGEAAPVEI
jgi:O-antigen/teichoic acid export membrane protein